MKYFSLNFTVNKGDYDSYYKDFGKGFVFQQLKRSAITLIFMLIMVAMYMTTQTAGLISTVVFIAIVSVFMPIVYSKKLAVSLVNSRNNRKENRYDFYADHIEIHIADENGKATTEKHLKMNGFVSVAESKSGFYFSYMNERVLIIPKRVLDEEKYGMIKNLIENYFSNVYMTV